MLGILLNLLVLVIVAVVVFMIVKYLMTKAGFEAQLQQIVLVILGLMFLIWLVNILSGGVIFNNVVYEWRPRNTNDA